MLEGIAVDIVSWLLMVIFAQASYHKITQWPRFCAALQAYRIAPPSFTRLFAAGVTGVEVILVFVLLIQPQLALIGAAVLLVIYAGAIGLNVVRGRVHIDCGCGDEPTPVSWLLVLRNMVLVVSAVAAVAYGFENDAVVVGFSWQASLISVFGAFIAFVLYSAVNQLLANVSRHQRLWLGAS